MKKGNMDFDVVVVGGGTAGVVAALQAERAGAHTLLVEKTGMLGGTLTMAQVTWPALFHAWGTQVIAGIGWDLVSRCVAEVGGTLPGFQAPHSQFYNNQVSVDGAIFAALCDEEIVAAGVTPLLHTMIAAVEASEDGWNVTLCTKTGLEEVSTRVMVDCTGDANVVSLAGLPLNIPETCQPASLVCRISGYVREELDIEAINRAFEAEVAAGRLAYTDASWNADRANVDVWLRQQGRNANHIHPCQARDSRGKTGAELAGRRSVLRLYRFLRTQPGLDKLRLEGIAAECGIRETATIVGKATITVDDFTSGRVWEDAICHAFYPIDLHEISPSGIALQLLREGIVPTVPRGALLPAGSRNLLVAGRCIASDQMANSALRVQATCMATGQAAGAMAALSAQSGIDVEQLPLSKIHDLLRRHGAIIP